MFRKALLLVVVLFCFSACCDLGVDFSDVLSAKSADGVSIAYADYGEGDRTLVFVHGWSCDSRYWNKQIEYFADSYRVITIDMAGHGNSGSNREAFTVDAFGQDVAAVLKAEDINNAVLIGHSMGGSVVMQAAALEPKRVIGVIGIDTLQDMGYKATDEEKAMYINPMKENFKKNADAFVRSMFPQNADKDLVDQVAADMSSADKRVAVSAIEEYLNGSEEDLAKQLNVPIKCLNADLWPSNVEANVKIAKDYELSLMKGYGHFIMLEAPDEFNEKLEELIENVK